MPNFLSMTDEEIFRYLINNFSDLEAGNPDENLQKQLINGAKNKSVIIKRRNLGFAILRKQIIALSDEPVEKIELMFLMVESQIRKNGIGTDLVNEIINEYGKRHRITLLCSGDKRMSFFKKLGFSVEEKDDTNMYSCTFN